VLYNNDNTLERFLSANNILDYHTPEQKNKKNIFLDKLERLARLFQIKIMSKDLKREINNSNGVFISDSVLKLYLRDRREEFLNKYNSKINEIL